MPNSNRGMFGRGSGTITVIEEPVMRSYRRKAKIVFYVTWVITATLAATVAASKWHPILALLAGLAFGLITAAIAGAVVAAWPVIRAIWWWTPETALTGGLVYGWIELAEHTTLIYRLAFMAVVVGIPVVVKNVRTGLNQLLWCMVTRHRIRTCFSEFIITNRTGSLPLILWARPTPVGERVWIWLRPGLALEDLLTRLDKIAVACWASTALAETASRSNAAFVRMDIKRRDALTGTITSPLLELIKTTPATERDTADLPTALDLPQVTASEVTPAKPARIPRAEPPRCPPRHHPPPRLPATSPTGSKPSHHRGRFRSPGRPLPRAARLTTPPPRREPQATATHTGPEVPLPTRQRRTLP